MVLHFYLRFSTQFGQTLLVCGNTDSLGNDDPAKAIPLQYLNDQLWHGSIDISGQDNNIPICYRYILQNENGEQVPEFGDDRIIDTGNIRAKKIIVADTWNHAGEYENAFFTTAFRDVLLKKKVPKKAVGKKLLKSFTHEFRVKAPLLNDNEVICISGSGTLLHEWDTEKVLLLTKKNNWWVIRLNMSKLQFPVVYKYAVYNTKDKKFIKFEEGNNRAIFNEEFRSTVSIIHDGFARVSAINWKGAGVTIPVFSLRSKNGFGTGEFADLKLMVDWAKKTGLKMIQVLPINDTTASHSAADSYPYSAISAFALHPLLLNLETVAGTVNAAVIKALDTKKKQLNKLPALDYEQVIKFKLAAIKELFELNDGNYKDDFSYFSFFEINRHWLEPYAAFSYLRDKYATADFREWKSHSVYNEGAIQRLVSPSQDHYKEISLHYFTQYHLHLQLKEAAEYAHSNGVILKGDIPIGICSNSVDAWVEPGLYHMDEQAGAPPDAFSAKGQNWGFPTYNWEAMQQNGFTWWRKRFEQMSNYFDAFRIDHILGFFRIWSIPSTAVEGIMGRFVPALPVSINELFEKNIAYERHRFTKPFVTEEILKNIFGTRTAEVEKIFFDDDQLKEVFDSQRKVENYFAEQEEPDDVIKQGLFDIISNVLLFEEPGSNGQKFHFRIAMEDTSSFKELDQHSQEELKKLYVDYFYHRQEELWRTAAMKKLPGLKRNTDMLVCGEDLGMVPHCVPDVMQQLGILSLEIQRMPKRTGMTFSHPNDAPYLSVVSPSTHDMSTIRVWWEEDSSKTKLFYNTIMGLPGIPPGSCEPEINKQIILQHLYAPAMWAVFQLQDLLGINRLVRRADPKEERINDPSNSKHNWNYRMHIELEKLLKEKKFNEELKAAVEGSGR